MPEIFGTRFNGEVITFSCAHRHREKKTKVKTQVEIKQVSRLCAVTLYHKSMCVTMCI